ncbi:homocysteine S-methyltransferase 1 [Megalops cyprinoides]|uniref:homocysteine S-methyltransferase 1 n=1 Tax=Megalops cyprinoides TaxID=118141 RepID=UPI001864DBDB|nr:homocysteine S-methyltransferase 1 [Megalops cyprinoides]XP_036397160.1 homocysteine S-methyltransferase 1 [Megalops cyprinoides]XP_036397161.1 homocysteine S-methyltransferase 1 [Megalops cyprinoides]
MMAKVPVILDGGLATELEAAGVKIQGDPLWSARILHTNPKAVKEAHYRFLNSGADVITTATYQASVEGFIQHLGLTTEQANQLLMSGVQLAKETVEDFKATCLQSGRRVPLVAGSIGPYGAFLHDGSEYSGAYEEKMSKEELKAWHRPQLHCLVSAGADLIAMETIPSLKEAEALVELLQEFPNSQAWLSFSCKDQQCISNGKRFSEAVQLARKSKQLVAVGVNCCAPTLVEPLLDSAGPLWSPDLCWVVYPNSGEEWIHETGWKATDRKTSFAELSLKWREQGAAWIGGCCRISPADIAEIRHQLLGNKATENS